MVLENNQKIIAIETGTPHAKIFCEFNWKLEWNYGKYVTLNVFRTKKTLIDSMRCVRKCVYVNWSDSFLESSLHWTPLYRMSKEKNVTNKTYIQNMIGDIVKCLMFERTENEKENNNKTNNHDSYHLFVTICQQ